jgi:hypothetical protein
VQPTNVEAGAPIVPAVEVAAVTGTFFAGAVTIALGPNAGGAMLSGTTTVTAVNGVARFSDLRVSSPGSYTLAASTNPNWNYLDATSNSFTVAAGAGSN